MANQPEQDNYHRRITDRLVNYWNSIRGGRMFPKHADICPEEIEDVWENCFVVKVGDILNGENYHFIHAGKKLNQIYGTNLKGKPVASVSKDIESHLSYEYDQVLKTRAPVIDEHVFKNKKGKTVKYRQCLLPLGNNDETVDHILCGMRFIIE